ncbi:MAG: hypothetical protein M3362_01940 [Acidobacteriota bacterium]|nr:hypothetical protein [Acidobacteriota bacterium]
MRLFRLLTLVGLAYMAVQSSFAANTPRKVDEYGALNCEDEMARLDNYAVELQADVTAKAVVVVYGGRRGTRRDEVRERLAFIRHYLTVNRSISGRRVLTFDGGFLESLRTDLWIIPSFADEKYLILPTVQGKDVKFRRGKFGNRIRRCGGIG